MATNDWTWLVVAVALIVLSVGGIWVAYQLARSQRHARARRESSSDYQPRESSSNAPSERLPATTDRLIRWGEGLSLQEAAPTTTEADRILWGDEWESVENWPASDAANNETMVKCLVCHQKVAEDQDGVFVCPRCHTVYHQACKNEYSGPCLICGE